MFIENVQFNEIGNKFRLRAKYSFKYHWTSFIQTNVSKCYLHTNHYVISIFYVFFILTLFINSHAQNLTSRKPIKSLLAGGITFDPIVNAKCERNLMQINIITDRPFNGLVHVRGFRKTPCQSFGNGSLVTTLMIDILAEQSSPNYCGVHKTKGSEERSVSIVIRLHRALELSDDKHFVITCGNTDFVNRNRHEKLIFKFVDKYGSKVSKLYHGEAYQLRAEILSSQERSSLSSIDDSTSSPAHISGYYLYVKNCLIFNSNDSDIEFLDSNGCPTLVGVEPFKQIEDNVAEAKITSMFKLPGTNRVHVQCLVDVVENCRFCEETLCSNKNGTRQERLLEQADMQMLASTTAYVFDPDHLMSASILSAGINNDKKECSEWRFPWLIALCIMLGVLLMIMIVINIFLCTSMSTTFFKNETSEEPSCIEDYDPYKIDVGGFYSPYNSRLSLNRYYPVGTSIVSEHSDPYIASSPQHATSSQFQADNVLVQSYSPLDNNRTNLKHVLYT